MVDGDDNGNGNGNGNDDNDGGKKEAGVCRRECTVPGALSEDLPMKFVIL